MQKCRNTDIQKCTPGRVSLGHWSSDPSSARLVGGYSCEDQARHVTWSLHSTLNLTLGMGAHGANQGRQRRCESWLAGRGPVKRPGERGVVGLCLDRGQSCTDFDAGKGAMRTTPREFSWSGENRLHTCTERKARQESKLCASRLQVRPTSEVMSHPIVLRQGLRRVK